MAEQAAVPDNVPPTTPPPVEAVVPPTPVPTEVVNAAVEAGPNDGVTQMLQHSAERGGGYIPDWAHNTPEQFRSWAEAQGIFGPDGSPVIPTGAAGYFDAQGNYWIDFHNHMGPQLAIHPDGTVTDVLRPTNLPYR